MPAGSGTSTRRPVRVHAILIHGMGRTPLSMLRLASRLREAGMQTSLFGYSVTFERFERCRQRLERFIAARCGTGPFVIVAHSLGSVLARAALAGKRRQPLAYFFLAPPTRACRAARFFAPRLPYRLLTGEMGQLLADAQFMDALPAPEVPTRVYAGTRGLPRRWSPFGEQTNDGILTLDETALPRAGLVTVAATHTFIMNSRQVATDIIRTTLALADEVRPPGNDG